MIPHKICLTNEDLDFLILEFNCSSQSRA